MLRRLGRKAATAAAAAGTIAGEEPENMQQLGRAALELGQTVGEIGVNVAQGTAQMAQQMGQDVVNAAQLGIEAGGEAIAERVIPPAPIDLQDVQVSIRYWENQIRNAPLFKEGMLEIIQDEIAQSKQAGNNPFEKDLRKFLRG